MTKAGSLAGETAVGVAEGPPGAAAATVDVVIPAYNEEADLEASVRTLHAFLADQFPWPWQITVVDNASTDQTWAIASQLADELNGVQALHLDQKGRGRALRAAWLASGASVVAYMDVDLSTDLRALLPLVAPLVSGHSHLAVGTRLAPGARVVRGPRREVISRIYNLLVKAMLRSRFSDAQCGFKAIRSDVARALVPLVEDEGWFFDTELLVLAEHNGLRLHEVPVDWVDDPDSRVDVVGTAKGDLRGIGRTLVRLLRGRAALPASSLPVGRSIEPSLSGQALRFCSIGLVSTLLFALLFVALAEPLGDLAAAVVAMVLCSIANTAANRRITFALRGGPGRVRQHLAGLAVNLLPLALTLATLGVLDAATDAGRLVQVLALTAANGIATAAKFVLLRAWVFRRGSGR